MLNLKWRTRNGHVVLRTLRVGTATGVRGANLPELSFCPELAGRGSTRAYCTPDWGTSRADMDMRVPTSFIRARRVFCIAALASVALNLPGPLNAATVPAGFTDSTIAIGLSSPTTLEIAPDGRIFVAEQSGVVRVIKDGVLLPTPFLTLNVNSSGERGLMGITFDPDFAYNGYVYVYYTTSAFPIHNRISRFSASIDNPDVAQPSETVLMDLEYLSALNHNGGALHFGADGRLYISTGDNALSSNSQSLGNRLGKVLRINPDGTIPPDNPFYGSTTGSNQAIWARGLRNPFTFAIQPGTGRMMINDVGQSSWEEIDDGIAGANYGWPTSEGPTNCTTVGFTCPIYSYDYAQGCAITGGAFYDPSDQSFPTQYVGKYFFADYCGNWIKFIDPYAPPESGAASTFATGISAPVDLRVGIDGSLYYLARGAGAVGRIGCYLERAALDHSATGKPDRPDRRYRHLQRLRRRQPVASISMAAQQGRHHRRQCCGPHARKCAAGR